MIDVDHFKSYNDRYGHQQGDQCLRAVATTLDGWTRRAGDIAARYGGEEFVILLPSAADADAKGVAESLRAAVQALHLEHSGNPFDKVVTVSIGVATMAPRDGGGYRPDDLVAAADAALYQAKHFGRNRVVAYMEPAASLSTAND